MCMRCDELEEEVAYWKSEAGVTTDAALVANLRHLYRLSKMEARVLEAAYRHRGRPLSRERMLELLGSEAVSPNIASVRACHIRAKIGKDALITNYGEGFSIGPAGIAAIEKAMRRAA